MSALVFSESLNRENSQNDSLYWQESDKFLLRHKTWYPGSTCINPSNCRQGEFELGVFCTLTVKSFIDTHPVSVFLFISSWSALLSLKLNLYKSADYLFNFTCECFLSDMWACLQLISLLSSLFLSFFSSRKHWCSINMSDWVNFPCISFKLSHLTVQLHSKDLGSFLKNRLWLWLKSNM